MQGETKHLLSSAMQHFMNTACNSSSHKSLEVELSILTPLPLHLWPPISRPIRPLFKQAQNQVPTKLSINPAPQLDRDFFSPPTFLSSPTMSPSPTVSPSPEGDYPIALQLTPLQSTLYPLKDTSFVILDN